MRQLTVKQKKLLKVWISEDPNIDSYEDLSSEQWNTLEKINDTEILWMETNRFINDERVKQRSKNIYER